MGSRSRPRMSERIKNGGKSCINRIGSFVTHAPLARADNLRKLRLLKTLQNPFAVLQQTGFDVFFPFRPTNVECRQIRLLEGGERTAATHIATRKKIRRPTTRAMQRVFRARSRSCNRTEIQAQHWSGGTAKQIAATSSCNVMHFFDFLTMPIHHS